MNNDDLPDSDDDEKPFADVIAAEHREWLAKFHPAHLRKWNADYKVEAQREAALHEAVVRRFLVSAGVSVEPNESPGSKYKAPDFRCETTDGQLFFVEATCIPTEKVAEFSAIPHGFTGARHFKLLTPRLWWVPKDKAPQCEVCNGPVLVAVGSFHSDMPLLFGQQKIEQVLTGETYIAWTIDTEKGKGIGEPWIETNLKSAMFFSMTGEAANGQVSGVLFFSTPYEDPIRYGVLNPNPKHSFDPTWLKPVCFGVVEPTTLAITWVQERPEMTDVEQDELFRRSGWTDAEIQCFKDRFRTEETDDSI